MPLTRILLFCFCALLLVSGQSLAKGVPRQPEPMDDAAAAELGTRFQFARFNQLSDAARKAEGPHLRSVPFFSGSFTYSGVVYPYTMVGDEPRQGGTTRIHTVLIPLSLSFDEYVDPSGNPITLDVTPFVPAVLEGPNFDRAPYGTGFTQFSDAVQRAQFYGVAGKDWHTLLNEPRVLPTVRIEVPVGYARVLRSSTGHLIAYLDLGFFYSQIHTIFQLAGLRVDELPIVISDNTFLYIGDLSSCCILGFHSASETKVEGNTHSVQTYVWATWLEPGTLRNPDHQDVEILTHELHEWMNDPFVNNSVPAWEFPGYPFCQANLETGDPIQVLPHHTFPVTLNGMTYHPQTEALLQWFTRESPSSAFGGAYSYPDTSTLPGPSQACPTGPAPTK